jgi:hypothetical protein
MTPPSSQREHNDRHRRTARPALQARYRRLYDELLEILIRLDPLGVHSTQPSALAPEVASILARLREARVADDVERIVLEELHRWYGRRQLAAVDQDRLADTTIAICTVWNHFLTDADS